MKRSLTGIKPTGNVHIGNYLGAMRPALQLTETYESSLYFIADYHAMTTVHDRDVLSAAVYDVSAAWLSIGLDPERTLVYRQWARSEVFAPASCSRRTPIICSSVNLARFMCPSFRRPDSNFNWRKSAGAGHDQPKIIKRSLSHSSLWALLYEPDAGASGSNNIQ